MFNLKKEKTKVEISLDIDSKEWEAGVQKVYEENKGKFNVVGFRKGHAPRRVIEQQYGDSVFFEDTVEYFVNKAINDVLVENPALEPVTMPTTQFESFTVENGLKMKVLFDIVPDFELCKYKDVVIKAHSSEVTDHDIEHQIGHLLNDNAKFETVDAEIKNGDSAVIDFTGYVDDVAFDGGAAQDYPLEIGSHTFIDNFEEQLIGHKKGDNVDVKVTFPENYGAENLKGKEAIFKCVVKEVRNKVVPELNDKFISDTTEFETVEEYKKDLVAHIKDMKDKQMEQEIEFNIREYLLENTTIEIPEAMVDNTVNEDIDRMKNALAAYNLSVEDYLTQTGTTLEKYIADAKVRTLKMIKTRYIYRKLIEENKIEVTKEELDKVAKDIKDENELLRKENELLLEKLYKFLRENNKIEIVK